MNTTNPFIQFHQWHGLAMEREVKANAMTLATVSAHGQPSIRTVALAEFDQDLGFVFYTDYTSQKANEMAHNPKVALLFYWPNLYRQVRINGVAAKTSAAISDKYFYQRAKEKQLSAILSHQSAILPDVDELRNLYAQKAEHLMDLEIERPETWGGYAIKPTRFEFWLGSEVRLHTRTVFEQDARGVWISYHIQP